MDIAGEKRSACENYTNLAGVAEYWLVAMLDCCCSCSATRVAIGVGCSEGDASDVFDVIGS